jgi:pseudaminic acid synthase
MEDIRIGNLIIGDTHRPIIIAEMSGNHNQSLDRAMKIVKEAAKVGAHAIKLQTYSADTMTIRGAYTIQDENSLWKGRELYELYEEAHTPWEWHKPIFEYARKLGILPFSTPFDETAVDFLVGLGVEAFKVASFENTDWPLLKKIAGTGKPVIMSTGVSSLSDIDESVRLLKDNGCKDLILLKCTSTYPATPENSNLSSIPYMRNLFKCHVGLSDHTMGIGTSIAAVAFGARVIEKHFTLRRKDGGVDSVFSIEPGELKSLVSETENAFLSIGDIKFGILETEKNSLSFKRSLYVVKNVKKGEMFTTQNLRVIRPGDGLPPKFFESVLGKSATTGIKAGTPLTWDMI